jgi:GH25 family lysozyme M1 (1,4-beta-N-acetylmuramidase)
MSIQGIDVASYQTATFDTGGLAFVFIKATEGTSYVNPKQTDQAAHGRAAGCVVGFYHFLHPGSVAAQAQYFVDKCASRSGDVLACDWEPTSSGLASNADKDAFIKAVKALRPDHRVILYCDLERWKNVDTTSYAGDGLWIADPNHPAGKPSVKSAWLFHQYGIRGTDRDLGNFTDRAALAAWAGSSQEDDVTQEDIDKLAAAVVAKLLAGGGALEQADLDRVWGDDVIPAARPPYNNSDYYAADGKTVANGTWTAKYAVQTSVEGIRETLARVKQLQEAGVGVQLGDAQVAALAGALAADAGLVDRIAEALAEKFAARLAE